MLDGLLLVLPPVLPPLMTPFVRRIAQLQSIQFVMLTGSCAYQRRLLLGRANAVKLLVNLTPCFVDDITNIYPGFP